MGDAHLIRLDVHPEPRVQRELRKVLAADRERAVRRSDVELRDPDARFHRAHDPTADPGISEA